MIRVTLRLNEMNFSLNVSNSVESSEVSYQNDKLNGPFYDQVEK